MNYEELSLSGFVKEIKEVSSGSHSRKFCFVLGAGASKSSGIKSGQELVNIWEKELLERNREEHLKWKEKSGINDTNKYEFYSQYYARRFRKAIDGYNYLEKMMESAKPKIGYVMLSYILTHTRHNVVITTNFDHLIEDAVNYYEHRIPLVIGHESLAHYITKEINRPMIIKIHRDLLLDPKNRKEELDVLHDNWIQALDNVFSEYHPIFIGYAGNDHSLMDFLIKSNDKFAGEEWNFPYWMIYKTDEMSNMVLEFLNNSNGYLIKHNGFDEVLCLLGAIFDYKLPSKEEFFRDVEKRFQMLSDSIDEFTENSSADRKTDQGENSAADNTSDETAEVSQAIQQITDQAELQRMFNQAVTLSCEDKHQGAIDIFRKLVEKIPKMPGIIMDWDTLFTEQNRFDEAIKQCRIATELDPNSTKYHDNLGSILYEMECYEEALREYQKLVELKPDADVYHNMLGLILHEMKRDEEAVTEYRKALALNWNKAMYHNNAGASLHVMGHYEEALKEYQKALELEPDNKLYRYNLNKISPFIKS